MHPLTDFLNDSLCGSCEQPAAFRLRGMLQVPKLSCAFRLVGSVFQSLGRLSAVGIDRFSQLALLNFVHTARKQAQREHAQRKWESGKIRPVKMEPVFAGASIRSFGSNAVIPVIAYPGGLRSHSRKDGFTLIEVVVVVAIMALLATIGAVSLRGTIDRYYLSQARQAIEISDAKARRIARTTGRPVLMNVDRLEKQIEIHESTFRIPAGVEIASVEMASRLSGGTQIGIPFSDDGWSPTYAIELKRGELGQWIVVIGASGQVVRVNEEGAANELLTR
jgi:general secretion pathway protein H